MLPLISQSIKAYEGRVEVGKMGKIQKTFSGSRPPNLQALSFYYVLVGCVSFKRLITPQIKNEEHDTKNMRKLSWLSLFIFLTFTLYQHLRSKGAKLSDLNQAEYKRDNSFV